MEISVDATGFDAAQKALAPKQIEVALIMFYERSTTYVRDQLRARAPGRIKGKVRIKTDGRRPPQWARIYAKSSLAHLVEGGTGSLGDPEFRHKAGFFPSWDKIARETGLPKPQAFLIARAIFQQGGTRARPFVRPTFAAVQGRIGQIADEAVTDALKGKTA